MKIRFYLKMEMKIDRPENLKKIIPQIFKEEKKLLKQLDFIFCDDAYLLEINRAYLNHNYLTDIITFNMSESGMKSLIGEIYISGEMITYNSIKFKTTFNVELTRVIFHGILHLCGYNDGTLTEKKIIRAKENFYLEKYLII